MSRLDALIRLRDEYPPYPEEDPDTAMAVRTEVVDLLSELFQNITEISRACGVSAQELADAISEGTSIKTLSPYIDIDDIVGEILVGGTARYAKSATRLDKILRSHIH
jgi:hypothetical protein